MNILPFIVLAQFTYPFGQNLNGGPITLVCDGGVSCSQQGETYYVSGSGSAPGGSGAPVDGGYLTLTSGSTGSTNEVVLSAGANINITGAGVVSVTGTVPSATTATTASTATALASNPTDCSANQYTTAIAANGDLTCAQVAYSQVSGTPTIYNQTIEDEATPLTQRTNINFTGAGVSCADTGGKTVCTISGGGPGSANVVEQSIALSGGSGFFQSVVTGQSWVTASSKVVCSVFGTTADGLTPEVVGVGGLIVSVSDLVASTGFTINVFSPYGLDGTVRVHCTGA